jgi:RNA-directed DNA polymerase
MTLTSLPTFVYRNERDVSQLARAIRIDESELVPWLDSVPAGFTYKIFRVPKRTTGFRIIASPSENLQALQSKIYKYILKKELIQSSVCGFVPGRSIVDNAIPHLNSQILIKIDLKDFFHSINDGRIFNFWKKDNWNFDSATILTRICCLNGSLPQGAPTSPALSNCVNQRFDSLVYDLSEKYFLKYTRYADDLTFSARTHHRKAEHRVRPFLDQLRTLLREENYEVQWQKGVKILRRHQRQIVTGILVNDRLRLPRETRNRLRALRHQKELGLLDEFQLKRLKGYELLNNMVERANDQVTPKQLTHRPTNQIKVLVGNVTVDMKNVTNVSGDVVNGNQTKMGDHNHGIQNVIGSTELPSSKATAEKWNRSEKLTLYSIISAVVITLASIIIAFWQTEIRELLGLK